MKAESPAAAQHWVEVLNRIRNLKDDTDEDRDSVSEQQQYPAHACSRPVTVRSLERFLCPPRAPSERRRRDERERSERQFVWGGCRTAVSPCGHMKALKPLMNLAPSLHPYAASSTNPMRLALLALDHAAFPLTFAHARDGPPNQPVRKPEETFCFCFKREKQNFDTSSDGTSTLPS